MDVREIKDLTLELARTGDKLETSFAESRDLAEGKWQTAERQTVDGNRGPFLIRVTGLPTISTQIPDITKRRDLWWIGKIFRITVADDELTSDHPSRMFDGYPRPRLRAFEMLPDKDAEQRLYRTLRGDGLVEFTLTHTRFNSQRSQFGTHIYFDWSLSYSRGSSVR